MTVQIGDTFTIVRSPGFKPVQNRPRKCQQWGPGTDGRYTSGCKCGECDGKREEVEGVVTDIACYDDGTYAKITLPDGSRVERKVQAGPWAINP